ncbi:hypothetical protein LCGC14_1690780 [marine sediment metagenome]|uniref:Uncharacterized protein n=1 Tax=marine sediment metagenome TaxID=412755 RepID=A0A0F9HKT5_9ZZZZ
MAKPHFARRTQDQILDARGLRRTGHGHLEPKTRPSTPGATFAMRFIEEKFSAPIRELIANGSNVEVADFLGLDPSTISKWRLRLGLR